MKKIAATLLMFFAVLILSVKSLAYPLDFKSGRGYQEIAYVGLGNANEVLAFAECSVNFTVPSFQAVPVKTITEYEIWEENGDTKNGGNGTFKRSSKTKAPKVTESKETIRPKVPGTFSINYSLKGDAGYIKRVRVWARPFDGNKDSNTNNYPNTYTHPFDGRDPVGKSGAILLAETMDVNATSMTVETLLAPDNYVVYLTVTLKSAEELSSPLPYLTDRKTKIGAAISNVLYKIPDNPKYQYTFNQKVVTTVERWECKWEDRSPFPFLWHMWVLGEPQNSGIKVSGPVETINSLTQSVNVKGASISVPVTMNVNQNLRGGVSRVIVPARKVLFAPNDYYSKYYRIPAIVTTSNGTLIAVSDARKQWAHDIANDIDMLARRSTDNGKSWSTPITVAKGEMHDEYGNITTDANRMVCRKSVGFGDAALAALPNGKVLLTMVHGAGIGDSDENLPTRAAFCISHDNGMTWSAPKDIDWNLYGKMRGCIAPGNMCVVKEGVLAGKVLASFRGFRNHDGSGSSTNYLLVFDPDTGKWLGVTKKGSRNGNNFNIAAGDDEAQLVEISENKFLISIRNGQRKYGNITISKVGTGGYQYSVKEITATGASWGTAANGAVMKVVNGVQNKNGTYDSYLLHTVVAENAEGKHRSSLSIYSAKNYTGGTINWVNQINISDPFDAIVETAQYSSMCVQPDGNVGLLFEEATNPIRADFSHKEDVNSNQGRGDYIMNSVFMSLRPADIIPHTVAPEVDNLERPIIQPITQVYNSQSTATQGSRPQKVVITHNNIVEPPVKGETETQVRTTYTFRYVGKNANKEDVTADLIYSFYDTNWVREANGKLPGENKGNPKYQFDKKSQTHEISWSEIEAKLIEKRIIKNPGDEIPKDAVIYVEAQCSRQQGTRISKSLESSERYHFIYPTRNVIIKAMSTSGVGAGSPTLTGGGRQVGPDQVIVVPSGDFVQISGLSATDNPFIKFSKFTYGPAFGSPVLVEKDPNITNGNGVSDLIYMNPQQIKFTLTDNVVNNYEIESLPGYVSGEANAVCIYVWYDVNIGEIGAKTQVITNYHRNADGNIAIRDISDSEIVSKSQLATNGDLENDFTVATLPEDVHQSASQSYLNATGQPNADYGQVAKTATKYMAAEPLFVPHDYNRWGIHLNIAVLPDANTLKNLNAVVMFVSNGNYLKRNGKYVYALLQGSLRPNRLLAQDAEFVGQWYASRGGSTVGAVANEEFSEMLATNPEYVPRDWSYFENQRGWVTYNHMKHPEYNGVKIYDIDKCEGFEVNTDGNVGFVMIFFVADDVANVESLFANLDSTKMNSLYLMYHPVSITDKITTGAEEVRAESEELIIANVPGGAQFIGGQTEVKVFNMMGNLVRAFQLDGVEYVELPSGIYIANGQKFIVR